MYTTMGRQFFFWWGGGGEGFLKCFEGKRGDGKNFLRKEGGCHFCLDVIKRLSICNIIDKPMKNVFITNALNCNVLYFVQ